MRGKADANGKMEKARVEKKNNKPAFECVCPFLSGQHPLALAHQLIALSPPGRDGHIFPKQQCPLTTAHFRNAVCEPCGGGEVGRQAAGTVDRAKLRPGQNPPPKAPWLEALEVTIRTQWTDRDILQGGSITMVPGPRWTHAGQWDRETPY